MLSICIIIVLSSLRAHAQNLVPDSSFENNAAIPRDFSAINTSYTWNMPSHGTSDLFCVCDRKRKMISMVDVPQNPMGKQEAHSGTCYAGLFAFSHGDYREYLQTPLTRPLEKNKTYLFTLHISLADYSRTSVDQLGACFLNAKATYTSVDVITDLDPVYMPIEKEVGKDISEWHAISVTYTARGGESYILIGSFELNRIVKTRYQAPKEARSRINQSTERDAYYFIDDVSLFEMEDLPAKETDETTEDAETEEALPSDIPIVLNNVLFETNVTTLLPSSYPELDRIADYLKKHPELRVEVSGHTDNSGTEKINNQLSAGRAKSVADYLVKKNIAGERITHKGFGSTQPVAENDTEEHKKQNRRVECVLH
jgi:outer membrane protein OmpA-like peptidoglycan-associated protein